jgi:hypothetical protein
MEMSSHIEMLPKHLITHLPVQDLDEWGFGSLLSRTVVHIVVGMEKTRGQHNKETHGR